MEWASAYNANETDWGTNTPSPFAGAMADEKSWLNGHVPGYDKLQRSWRVMEGMESDLLEISYTKVHSCTVLLDLRVGDSHSGVYPKGSASAHLQTFA
jgi:hypothetical protein